jgi:endonuclease-3
MCKIEKVNILLVFLHKRHKERQGTESPFHVLVSTVLSQRTRDEITGAATKRLLAIYDTPQKLADAPLGKIENRIKPVGFYHTKAKRLKEISWILIERYNGNVPRGIDELLSLPGVGRKTANCVLVYGFGIPALAVDTHVHRISNRVGLVETKTPYETEIELSKIVPTEEFGFLNTAMVRFGREICRPLHPLCNMCGIRNVCDKVLKNHKVKSKTKHRYFRESLTRKNS